MNVSNRIDGHMIELFVADKLRDRGFVVLEMNYMVGKIEVDIIALEGDTLCFIEVKARNKPFVLSELDQLITSEKKRHLLTVSDVFCRNVRGVLYRNIRYDYALVYAPYQSKPRQVQYFRNAFVPTLR